MKHGGRNRSGRRRTVVTAAASTSPRLVAVWVSNTVLVPLKTSAPPLAATVYDARPLASPICRALRVTVWLPVRYEAGMSAATSVRNVAAAGDPVDGPASTVLALAAPFCWGHHAPVSSK